MWFAIGSQHLWYLWYLWCRGSHPNTSRIQFCNKEYYTQFNYIYECFFRPQGGGPGVHRPAPLPGTGLMPCHDCHARGGCMYVAHARGVASGPSPPTVTATTHHQHYHHHYHRHHRTTHHHHHPSPPLPPPVPPVPPPPPPPPPPLTDSLCSFTRLQALQLLSFNQQASHADVTLSPQWASCSCYARVMPVFLYLYYTVAVWLEHIDPVVPVVPTTCGVGRCRARFC